METLKTAVQAAIRDLRIVYDRLGRPTMITFPLGTLSGVLSSIPEGGHAPIDAAKKACEQLIDCARIVVDRESAEDLRCIARTLSLVVARSYNSNC